MKVSVHIECEDLEELLEVKEALAKYKKDRQKQTFAEEDPAKAVMLSVQPGNRFIPLTQWEKFHPWPKTSSLRQLVFFSETNGFKKCIKKVGRRVIIDEAAFFEWVREQEP